jgi:16S rRNA (uracil1498-N3)-methyltransferase
MRLHRFLIEADLNMTELVINDRDLARQIKLVLRLEPGDKLVLTDGRGNEAQADIVALSGEQVKFKLDSSSSPNRESPRELTLLCAVLKRENFELVAQKAVELGVARIQPLLTERTVKLGLNFERVRKIIKEAVEQSGRCIIPELNDPITFIDSLGSSAHYDLRIIFDSSGLPLRSAASLSSIAVWVGPEGGWTEAELAAAKSAGLTVATLGPRTLRAETAAIAATYALTMA